MMPDRADSAMAIGGFHRVARDGSRQRVSRDLPEEAAIAIEVNGIGYAVLMASPVDLEDLAVGFCLADRLVDAASDVLAIDAEARGSCQILVRMTLVQAAAARVFDRVRHRASDSSCGLCGIETLEQAMRPLPRLEARTEAGDDAIFRALDALGPLQAINHRTGAVHAAAWCRSDGSIAMLREDVGRHNAFDKLIGAMARGGKNWEGGFALLTSRCSFELVEKAALAACPMLVTISAPTNLAVARAREAGLPLRVLARPDAVLATSPDDLPAQG